MSKLIVSEIESTGTTVQINDDLKVGTTGTNAITSGNVVSPSEDMIKFFKAYETPVTAFDAAVSSTGVPGNTNAVPYEISTAAGFTSTTALAVTSTGNSLLTNFSADAVFLYKSSGTANCKNDYWGITIDIPKVYRGQNIILNFDYRTENASANETAADQWFIAVQDKTNTVKTTVTNTALVSAGAAVTVASKAGLVVGDKIWLEGGGNAQGSVSNDITQTYITSISGTANEITLSQDYTPASTAGSIAVVGYLSDTLDLLAAADSDTNKIGKNRKLAFKTAEDTAQVNVWFQLRNTDSVVYSLFMDNIYISANKFLQASSQGKIESYVAINQNSFWSSTSTTYVWDETLLVPQGSPPLAQSKLISISSTVGSQTRITAKQDIIINASITGYPGPGGVVNFRNSTDDDLNRNQQADGISYSNYRDTSVSIFLAKNDYIYAVKFTGTNTWGAITLTAQSQVSDVILLESQDEIFTDWTDFTPTWSTGGGPPTVHEARWRRVGSDMEVYMGFQVGTTSATTAWFNLPAGYDMDVTAFSATTSSYHPVGNYMLPNINYSGNLWVSANPQAYTNILYFTYSDSSGYSYNTVRNWSHLFSSSEKIEVRYKVPIQGWNANFNPLLSMPLVEIGSNIEYGRWGTAAGYGTAATKIQHYSTETVNTISNLGTVLTDATDGWRFTANQRVKVTASSTMFMGGGGNIAGWSLNGDPATNVTSLATEKILCLQTSAANNYGFNSEASLIMEAGDVLRPHTLGNTINSGNYWRLQLTVEKDFSNTNMAHIIKPAVAILTGRKAYNTNAGSASTSWTARSLTNIEGESWFVTLSGAGSTGVGGNNTDFTLEKGTYKMDIKVPNALTERSMIQLYDVTNSKTVSYSSATNARYGGGNENSVMNQLQTTFTIGASTEFNIKNIVALSTYGYGNGLGNNRDSTMDSVFSMVTIEKLK